MLAVHEHRAGLDRAVLETSPRPHPAPDPIASLEHDHVEPVTNKLTGARQPGGAGTDDDNIYISSSHMPLPT
jgi:hypothetical protein